MPANVTTSLQITDGSYQRAEPGDASLRNMYVLHLYTRHSHQLVIFPAAILKVK